MSTQSETVRRFTYLRGMVEVSLTASNDRVVDAFHELPEEFMSQIAELAGDGKARVSVTVDQGIKNYGNGASASVTVSLTCNQDMETVRRAIGAAQYLANHYTHEVWQQADDRVQRLLQDRGGR